MRGGRDAGKGHRCLGKGGRINAPLTQAERIAALEEKCTLLAASLRQAETQTADRIRRARNDTVDCARLYKKHSLWSLASFASINRFADEKHLKGLVLDEGDRQAVCTLARLGEYLADYAADVANNYREDAEEATA